MSRDLRVTRHENKYFLDYADYVKARFMLQRLMQHDAHGTDNGDYFIRSLYFDDQVDSALHDKLSGIEMRDKYRLRTYDYTLDWLKLERKRKRNDYITKTSIRVSRTQANALIKGTTGGLLESSSHDARMLGADFARCGLRPVVLIDYEREAYVLPYNNIRITFDKNLRSSTHDLSLFGDRVEMRPALPPGVVVLEVKFNHFLPPWFTQALQLDNPLRSAISKYTISRLQAGDFAYI